MWSPDNVQWVINEKQFCASLSSLPIGNPFKSFTRGLWSTLFLIFLPNVQSEMRGLIGFKENHPIGVCGFHSVPPPSYLLFSGFLLLLVLYCPKLSHLSRSFSQILTSSTRLKHLVASSTILPRKSKIFHYFIWTWSNLKISLTGHWSISN